MVATTPRRCTTTRCKRLDWFAERLTVNDTDALTPEQQRETLAEMQALYGVEHGQAMYKQEYECDWASALLGSFYALEMQQVREEGRIIECEPIEGVPVNLAWDLGVSDDTSIWWWQAQPSGQLLILDHYAASGVGLEHYCDVIQQREQAARMDPWIRLRPARRES